MTTAISRKQQTNNTSGITGVSYHSSKGMWYARINIKGKTHSLGYFLTRHEAAIARRKAEAKIFDAYCKRNHIQVIDI